MENISKYKFSTSVLNQSAGNFKQFVKVRYPKLTGKEIDALTDKFYPEDTKDVEDGNSTATKSKTGASKE